MATPNPRDKHSSRKKDGTTIDKILIGGFYACMAVLCAIVFVQGIKKETPQQAEMLSSQESMPAMRDKSKISVPDPHKEADNLTVLLKRYDSLIADVSSRITSYREPIARLGSELSALGQTRSRLEAIGDVRGRNEVVSLYNEKGRQHNAVVAEQSRYIAHQITLVRDRNMIAEKINQLRENQVTTGGLSHGRYALPIR